MPFRYEVVEAAHGKEYADEWLLQTYRIYRTGIYGTAKNNAWMRTREYRPRFLQALIGLRKKINGTRQTF